MLDLTIFICELLICLKEIKNIFDAKLVKKPLCYFLVLTIFFGTNLNDA